MGFVLVLVFKFVTDLATAEESANAADDIAQQALIFEFRVTVGISFFLVLIFKFRVTVLTFWTTVMHRFVSDGCLKKCHNETSLFLCFKPSRDGVDQKLFYLACHVVDGPLVYSG